MNCLPPHQPVGRERMVPKGYPQAVKTAVIVDSRDRDFAAHPSSSQFVFKLPERLNNVTDAVLVSAELPLSYYVFSAARGNTSLAVVVGGTRRTVTIRDGNYSTASMASELTRVLQEAFPGTTFEVGFDPVDLRCSIAPSSGTVSVDTTGVDPQTTWTVSSDALHEASRNGRSIRVALNNVVQSVAVPASEGQQLATDLKGALEASFPGVTFLVTYAGNFTITPSAGTIAVLASEPTKRTEWGLGYYLGFEWATITAPVTKVTAPRMAFLNPENYLLIHVEQLGGVLQNEMYGRGGGRKAFAKVPLNGDSYQYNYYDKTLTVVEARPLRAKLDELHVSLRFHDGTLVDLNGGEWSMAVEFTTTLTVARVP